jgi:hypothetical protein
VSKISPSKPRIGGEKSAGKLPKLKFLETLVVCIIGELETTTGVCKEGLCKLSEKLGTSWRYLFE